jgi:hypothetical protein
MTRKSIPGIIVIGMLLVLLPCGFAAQKDVWRQATAAQLAAVLPSRAPVGDEHIETEMRTASGIVDGHGHYVAGVVMITAGYSADGKYSHYMIVQAPMKIGHFSLKPGQYVFGWTRSGSENALTVHFYVAATGQLVGTATAHWIQESTRIESLHIWPPADKSLIQIGRFGIPYQVE